MFEKTSFPDNNKQTGFTLIELLLVMGVTGVVTVFSGLNLIGFQRRTTIRTTTDELVSNLRKVQSLSIAAKNNTSYGVHFEKNYYVVFEGPLYNSSSSSNANVSLPQNIELSNINLSSDDSVIFSKISGYPDYTGSLEISLSDQIVTITINSEGVIEILESGNIDVPDSFNLLSPLTGSVEDFTLTPTFDWEDSSGSGLTYQLWHSTDINFSTKTVVDSGVVSNVSASLVDNTRHYWKVRAINDQGFSTWSNQVWYIDTQVLDLPTDFDLKTPINGDSLTIVTPFFDWGDSIDLDGGGILYDLWVDDNSDFSSLIINESGLSVSEYSTQITDGLQDNQNYFWKVRAVDESGSVVWSNQTDWSFEISSDTPPSSFNLLSPVSGYISDSTDVLFEWEDSIDSDLGDTVTYSIIIDNNSDFSSPETQVSSLSSSSYISQLSDNLSNNQTYYWKVIVVSGGVEVESFQVDWYFSIKADIYVDQNISASGDGTSWDRAYKTLEEAIVVLQGGSVVNVAGGVYAETISLNTTHSGTVGDLTTFIGKSGDEIFVTGGGESGLLVDGTEYLSVSGFSFSNNSKYGVEILNGSYNVLFEDCEFSNNIRDGLYAFGAEVSNITIQNSISSNNGDNGLELQGSNYLIDNLISNNNVDFGIYMNRLENSLVKNSTIEQSGEYGIYINYGTSVELNNNIVTSSGYDRDRDNIYSYRSISLLLHHNVLSNASRRGLFINQLDLELNGLSQSEIHHNVIFSNATDGLYATDSYGGRIYNNTIDSSGQTALYLQKFNGQLIVRNNLLTNSLYGFNVRKGNSNLNFDYANLWGNTNHFRNQGAMYVGNNSTFVDPYYINQIDHDYFLQTASPCIDSGDPDSFYNDLDGTVSDIGAYGEVAVEVSVAKEKLLAFNDIVLFSHNDKFNIINKSSL